MSNIYNVTEDKCSGCGLCKNICPVDAISMVENSEGFIYPHIDMGKCINCGKCLRYCPVENPEYNNNKNPECHAIYANDDIRMKAASGGIFSAFAEKVIKEGGVAAGAAYGENFSVEFKMAETLEELEPLKSSKYVQGDAKYIYRDVKEKLLAGKTVLFGGCPCQVAALYKFLEDTNLDNLYTMDIICHGVPSPKVFRKYLDENFKEKHIYKIDFRDKTVYGWSTEMNIYFDDKTVFRKLHTQDAYYNAFLPCMSLRKSCSKCRFSVLPRQGDITIGDFWGIDHFDKSLNDRKGTSVVLVNNKKGRSILKQCSQLWVRDVVTPIDEALRVNKTIIQPFKPHPARKRFFENLDKCPLDILVKKCSTHHYDIGIVGLWYGLNYGSILTYYALYKVVNDMGFDAIMVNKPNELWISRYIDRNTIANKFIYENCYVSNVRDTRDDWEELNDHCDAFIVGSDVVWNYQICGEQSHQFFFLDFVDDKKKKIAMASSFGSGYNAPEDERILDGYYLQKFDYVGVREKEGVDICKTKFNVEASRVMDPVFLCDKKYYLQFADKVNLQSKAPFLAAYILGPDQEKYNIVKKVSGMLDCNIEIIENPNTPGKLEKILGAKPLPTPSVEEWLSYIKNCEFFVGDSFHGLCFSLICNKPFLIAVNSNVSGMARFTTLLGMVGLQDRLFITDKDNISKIDDIINKKIDYTIVNKILENSSRESYEWLLNALKSEKKYTATAYDIMVKRLNSKIAELESKLNK